MLDFSVFTHAHSESQTGLLLAHLIECSLLAEKMLLNRGNERNAGKKAFCAVKRAGAWERKEAARVGGRSDRSPGPGAGPPSAMVTEQWQTPCIPGVCVGQKEALTCPS